MEKRQIQNALLKRAVDVALLAVPHEAAVAVQASRPQPVVAEVLQSRRKSL